MMIFSRSWAVLYFVGFVFDDPFPLKILNFEKVHAYCYVPLSCSGCLDKQSSTYYWLVSGSGLSCGYVGH